MAADNYNKASVAEKLRIQRERIREPAIACPYCEARTPVADLLSHIDERCPGHKAVHPLSRWVTWREAAKRGASGPSLWRWVKLGMVRTNGQPRKRRYLLRDLVRLLAARRSPRDGVSK